MNRVIADSVHFRPQQYLTLLELTKAIAKHRNLAELFHDLADRLHQIFDFQMLSVLLPDEANNALRQHVLETNEPPFNYYRLKCPSKILCPAGSGSSSSPSLYGTWMRGPASPAHMFCGVNIQCIQFACSR